MKRYDLIVVGAGPSGLSAAIEAAKCGLSVAVFDENEKPGGQLFKQIHKFFGSKEHRAKIRGFQIGRELLEEAERLGVRVELNSTVTGLYQYNEITVRKEDGIFHYKGDAIIVATGASENMVPFYGWTLPGVIGAGAAQTMMNLHAVQPGKKVLMLGSGNVGLVVSFQLLQCGCEVVAVVDAAPRIGGYGVHAAKLARTGVPFYLSHTIKKAEGTDRVTGVTITKVDESFQPVPGSEIYFEADTICVAVGLSPMSQLLSMAGAEMTDNPLKGGLVPAVNAAGETSLPGVYAAGDVSGIEEASSAMIEGKIAAAAAAHYLGYLTSEEKDSRIAKYEADLDTLRQGMFAPGSRGKSIENTEEGIPISFNLLQKGFLTEEDTKRFPGVTRQEGIHPVIECSQNIPCNPCQDACPKGCIQIGKNITALPCVNTQAACTGCGLCVSSCSGQAIFLVNENYEDGYAAVTFPYEFCPLPAEGSRGLALTRNGEPCGEAVIIQVRSGKAYDSTNLVTMRVKKELAGCARFFKCSGEEQKIYG